MYYNSEEIDQKLECSICRKLLTGAVKLIPDCGEMICADCYDDLTDAVNESSQFKCRACRNVHAMPPKGLPEVKSLNKILDRCKVEKSLSDEAKRLKSTIASFEDQMKALKSFDKQEHINQHCDQLEVEVIEEVESIRKQVNEMEKELLKQIGEYREICLQSWSIRSTTQSKDAPIQSGKIENDLEALNKQIAEFSAKWVEYFNRIDVLASEREVAAALEDARQFEKKMEALQKRLNSDAFNGQTMAYIVDESLLRDQKSIITLTIQDNRVKEWKIQPTPSDTLLGHSDLVNQFLFLPDGSLASCSDDRAIGIWDVDTGDMMYKLEGHSNDVHSLALLVDGSLASGSADKTIKIWNLDKRKHIRTLKGHDESIVAFQVLKNGNLASLSLDGVVKVWNPYTTTNNLVMTIAGHGNTKIAISLGILSNETLVTCSVGIGSEETAILNLLNSNNRRLIKSLIVNISSVYSFLVLSNDQVALGSKDGTIKIIDLSSGAEVSSVSGDGHGRSVHSLAQLPNGDLVSCCEIMSNHKSKIQVWSIDGGLRLVQSITTDHSSIIFSLAISPNGTLLASGSFDGGIKLWPISWKFI